MFKADICFEIITVNIDRVSFCWFNSNYNRHDYWNMFNRSKY